MFESVVIVLAIILDCDCFAQVTQLDYHLRIIFVNCNWRDVFDDGFDLLQNIRHENRMIR